MNKYVKPLAAVVLFLACQMIVSLLIAVVGVFVGMDGTSSGVESVVSNPHLLAAAVIVSNVLFVVLAYVLRMVRRDKAFNVGDIRWSESPRLVVGAICIAFALNVMSEMIDLADNLAEHMILLAGTPLGMLALAVFGPVAEEVAFREAMIDGMCKQGTKVSTAIIVSSLCFGIVHGNPAQIPFAACMGVVLALIYLHTGNIVLTSIVHVINNGIAVCQMNFLGDRVEEFKLVDMLGGTVQAVAAAIFLVIVGCLCLRITLPALKAK